MRILFLIAWRNVWRNPRRSWVLLTAIAVGVFCFIGSVTFMDGFGVEMINSAIELQGGHIQVAADGYQKNPNLRRFVREPDRVAARLAERPAVHIAPRVVTTGMANSPEQSAGVQIIGVDPAQERKVTVIADKIVEGRFLSSEAGANEVVIGVELADRLKLRLGEKLVLMTNDLTNQLSAGAYRIAGLFQTSTTTFDKTNLFIHLDDARSLVGFGDQVTYFTVRMEEPPLMNETVQAYQSALEGRDLEVLSWEDRFPALVLAMEAYDYSVVVLVIILFAAVAATIVNSFLMVIFERIREIGIMMANGITPGQVRILLYLEACLMVLIGTAVGVVLSVVLLGYFFSEGLDLSNFAQGLGEFGVGAVVYPYLDWGHLGLGFAIIALMVALAVFYPAFKASRFGVVEAINHV